MLSIVVAGMLAIVHADFLHGAASRPLRITYLSNSVTMAPLWMAKETGAIAKEALDVEILSMTASVAVPALLANELDAVEMSAAPVLTAALRGHDLVFVCGLLNTMIWNFYGRPEIPNAEALRGKIVATDRPGTPGTPGRYGTMVSLKRIGLSAKDVQLLPIGSSAYVIAALNAGQAMGGIASPPVSFQLERMGFHQLTTLLDVPYQNVGIVIRRSRFDELKPRLIPLLRALRAGIDRYNGDKNFTLKVIAKYSRGNRRRRARQILRVLSPRRLQARADDLRARRPGNARLSVRDHSGSEESQAGAILRRPFGEAHRWVQVMGAK